MNQLTTITLSEIESNEFKQCLANELPAFMAQNPHEVERYRLLVEGAVRRAPKLLQCTRDSFMDSVHKLMRLGVSPLPEHGHAALIPRFNNKTKQLECNMQLEYRGKIHIAIQSGNVKTINASCIYDQDDFDYTEGTDPNITHKPNIRADRSDEAIIGAYAVAFMRNGEKIIKVMNKQEIDKIRNTYSESYKNQGAASPWAKSFSEMACKTVVHRLCKFLPLSNDAMAAINADAQSDTIQQEKDITPMISAVDALKAKLMPPSEPFIAEEKPQAQEEVAPSKFGAPVETLTSEEALQAEGLYRDALELGAVEMGELMEYFKRVSEKYGVTVSTFATIPRDSFARYKEWLNKRIVSLEVPCNPQTGEIV